MKIVVDMDDTLFDYWAGVVTKKVSFEYGIDLTPRLGSEFTWDNNPVKNFFEARGETWWDWMRNRDWLWTLCKPFPGSIGTINDWRKQGHFVEVLTKKPEWAQWTVPALLAKWRIAVDRVTMQIITEDPRTYDQAKKHEVSDGLLLIDDNQANLTGWLDAGRPAICFTQPWNTDFTYPGCSRADDWTQLRHIVEAITRQQEAALSGSILGD